MMRPNSTVEFRIFRIFWSFRIFWISLVLQQIPCAKNSFLLTIQRILIFICCYKSSCAYEQLSISFAILENSTLRQDWNFDLCLHQISLTIQPVDLEAFSIPGLLDAIGLFTDEELVRTQMTKFVAVGLDFATILFSSFCSCIIFAILPVKLIKLKFLAQQRELKWLMLNKWRRLFHSSRVKFPFVKMSAIWCLVSMCLIGILRIQIDSVKQPIKSNSAGSWHMSHWWTPAFEYHLNHGFIVLKTRTTWHWTKKISHSKAQCQLETNQNCRAWLELWLDSWCACLTWCDARSHPLMMNPWFYWVGLVINGALL